MDQAFVFLLWIIKREGHALFFIAYVNSYSRKLLCVRSVLGLLGAFRYSPGLIMKCVCMEGALVAEMAGMNTPLCPLGKGPFCVHQIEV